MLFGPDVAQKKTLLSQCDFSIPAVLVLSTGIQYSRATLGSTLHNVKSPSTVLSNLSVPVYDYQSWSEKI